MFGKKCPACGKGFPKGYTPLTYRGGSYHHLCYDFYLKKGG